MYNELRFDEKEKTKVELRARLHRNEQDSEQHAEWLDYNVSKVAGNKCRKDALEYAQHKDPRQTGVRRKHERRSI